MFYLGEVCKLDVVLVFYNMLISNCIMIVYELVR